jgi:hypothetical protein
VRTWSGDTRVSCAGPTGSSTRLCSSRTLCKSSSGRGKERARRRQARTGGGGSIQGATRVRVLALASEPGGVVARHLESIETFEALWY